MMTKPIGGRFHIEVHSTPIRLVPGERLPPDEKADIRIVKTSTEEVIPEDEALMLIRASDPLALPLLCHYQELSRNDGRNDFHMEEIKTVIRAFKRFQHKHPERMKQPGITRGK